MRLQDESYLSWSRSVVSGWGDMGPGLPSSRSLRQVSVPVVGEGRCNDQVCRLGLFGMTTRLPVCRVAETQMCAGGQDGRGACKVRFFFSSKVKCCKYSRAIAEEDLLQKTMKPLAGV